MLAKMGYTVFAIDLYGVGNRPKEISERKKMTESLYKDRAKMRLLMNGALDFASSQGVNLKQAVVIGYCFGGAAVLELARTGVDLKGFVAFHGGLSTPEDQDFSKTKGKLLI